MIPYRSITIECIDILSFLLFLLHEVSLELDTSLLREDGDCFSEIYLLDFHDEPDRSSSFSTGKAVSDIFRWRYDE